MAGSGQRACIVPDCKTTLEKRSASAYCWRYRVCSTHLNASEVVLKGARCLFLRRLAERGAALPPTLPHFSLQEGP